MTGRLITTTSGRDLTTLGTGGQRTLDCWNTLTLLLKRELSAEHAALLAEPLSNAARGTVDWYSQQEGVPGRFAEASFAVQEEVSARLQALTGDIEQLVLKLAASSSGSDRFLSSMLSLALEIPSMEFLYQVDAHPILVAWGHKTAGAQPQGVTLTGHKRRDPVRDQLPTGVPAPPSPPRPEQAPSEPRPDPQAQPQPQPWHLGASAKPSPAARAPQILAAPPKVLLWRGEPEASMQVPRFGVMQGWVSWFTPYRMAAVLFGLLLFFLLLTAFAWSRPSPAPCADMRGPLALAAMLQDAQGRGAALQIEKAGLAQDLAARRTHCRSFPAAPKAAAP